MGLVTFAHRRREYGRAIVPLPPLAGRPLKLHVIFTNLLETEATLRAVTSLARGLEARLNLLVAKVVPYPLPLDRPPVSIELTQKVLQRLASRQEVETTVQVHLCRDQAVTIRQVLGAQSVVAIGAPKRWWPTAWRILAWKLKKDGHHVILVDTRNDTKKDTKKATGIAAKDHDDIPITT
jgi:hypothetical protein